MHNLRLKFAILEKFPRQADFCRESGLREDRLSRLVNGRSDPTEAEKRLIEAGSSTLFLGKTVVKVLIIRQ